jgi:hypothetical protein
VTQGQSGKMQNLKFALYSTRTLLSSGLCALPPATLFFLPAYYARAHKPETASQVTVRMSFADPEKGFVGAPIHVENKRKNDPIDPTLDSCCQREIEENRKWNAIQATLKRHDRIARRERMRRNAVQLLTCDNFGGFSNMDVCRCMFDPGQDGGEYEALRNLRLLSLAVADDKSGSTLRPQNDPEEEGNVPTAGAEEESSFSDDDDSDDFDYLLDDKELPGAKEFEEQRREEFEEALLYREFLFHHGYGTVRQMHPLRVLRAAGLSNTDGNNTTTSSGAAVVLHLFDPTSDMSASLDLVLESISPTYKGTMFLRSAGRPVLNANPYSLICKVISEEDLPALIAVKDGCVVATCPNLRGLGYAKVDSNQVTYWLDRANVLIRDPPSEDAVCRISPDVDALLASGILGKKEEVQRQYFNCGVPGCQKSFYHEHVGVKTEEQDGLVIKEDGYAKDI